MRIHYYYYYVAYLQIPEFYIDLFNKTEASVLLQLI